MVHRTRRRRLNRTPWQPRRRLSRVPSARPPTSSRRSTPCRAVSSSAPASSDAPPWRRRSPALRHLASLGERKSSPPWRAPFSADSPPTLHWRLSGWAAPQGCALQVPHGWRAALGPPGERPSRLAASGSHMVPPSACAHPILCTHPVHPSCAPTLCTLCTLCTQALRPAQVGALPAAHRGGRPAHQPVRRRRARCVERAVLAPGSATQPVTPSGPGRAPASSGLLSALVRMPWHDCTCATHSPSTGRPGPRGQPG